MENIRQEIDYNSNEFLAILKNKNFKKLFKEIHGEKLVRNPKNYSSDHPQIEYLKFKSFTVIHSIEDKDVLAKNFTRKCIKVFKEIKPLNDFLNRTIE